MRPPFRRRRLPKTRRPRGTNWQPGGGDIPKDDADRYEVVQEGPYGLGREKHA